MWKKVWLLWLVTTVSYAATPSQQLEDYLAKIHTMRADFKQEIFSPYGRVLFSSNGKMILQRPGKFRWDTDAPSVQQVIANGQIVWVYDADLQQATRQTQRPDDTHSPASLLSETSAAVMANFKVENKDGVFKLLPKHPEHTVFTAVELTFKNQQLTSMVMRDKLDQETKIQFSAIQINANLPADTFTFNPPQGVDLIEN